MAEAKLVQQFASDNYCGICPEALTALNAANEGHAPAYGEDEWTFRAAERMRILFETDCDVYFAFNGTAANSMALASLCQSYHGVICHEWAHVARDECGGPEFFSNGSKLLTASGKDGKLTPAAVEAILTSRTDIHFPKPRVVTLTQPTEVGTVYSIEEIAAISSLAHAHGLRVHMDGARFANAIACTGVSPAEATWRAGIDVLCFGGTKMGLPVGEAIIFFDRALSVDFAFRCKQAGQLASKMRFLAAPWLGMLENDVWLKYARHANSMAMRLGRGLAPIPGVEPSFPVQTNGVFVALPEAMENQLRDLGWNFYSFIAKRDVRFMCGWDTRAEGVDRLLTDARFAADRHEPNAPR